MIKLKDKTFSMLLYVLSFILFIFFGYLFFCFDIF